MLMIECVICGYYAIEMKAFKPKAQELVTRNREIYVCSETGKRTHDKRVRKEGVSFVDYIWFFGVSNNRALY